MNKNKILIMLILSTIIVASTFDTSLAQPQLTLPPASFLAEISQTIGLTKIVIKYHRPGVKGRNIWGDLVPYNEIWRAGANENTVISFSDPVKIEGKALAAGKYGLHIIPSNNEWTIIFSNVSWAWGSFSYDEKEDALRVKVNPESASFEERLSFRMDNPTENSVIAALYWANLRIPIKIEVDVPTIVLKSIRKQLRDLPQFFWQGWHQAANYCLQNNINHEEALQWAERSISMNKNFTNLQVKAGLLEQMDNKAASENIMKEALKLASESEMNFYGYQLMAANKIDEAIEVFKKNAEDYPKSWNVYDSLAEGYAKKGAIKNAVKFYTKALKMVDNEDQKERISKVLTQLEPK